MFEHDQSGFDSFEDPTFEDPTFDDTTGQTIDGLAEPDADGGGPQLEEISPDTPIGGALGEPDGVTADSYAEEYTYLNSTGDYRGESGREIDPWTSTEKK